LISKFALEYAIRKIQANQKGLVYANDVHIMDENITNLKKIQSSVRG